MPIEWWVVLATLAGPIAAVQTQKWVERATESRRRKYAIFNALMANRATRLADEFVKALNLIDIEFLPGHLRAAKNRAVINAWRALFGELHRGVNDGETDIQIINAWHQRCDDRLVDLLAAMSSALGYSFSSEELRRGIYYPKGHVEREQAQTAILSGVRLLLEGKQSLPMKITETQTSPEAAMLQATLAEKMAAAYREDGALKVKILGASSEPDHPHPG
jgi:hypothetical protein